MDVQTLLVAVIGATGLIGQGFASARRHRKIDSAIGTPNGQGNVVAMLETVIRTTGRLEEKLDRHISDPAAHAGDE